MEKPLSPPPAFYSPFTVRDPYLARVTNIEPLEKPDPYAGCQNGSDRLERMLELAEQNGLLGSGNHLLTRP